MRSVDLLGVTMAGVVACSRPSVASDPPPPTPTSTPVAVDQNTGVASPSPADPTAFSLSWRRIPVDARTHLRGLSVASDHSVWASGSGGTVVFSIDAGETWQSTIVPGAEGLELRDIEAFDAREVVVLSAGSPGRVWRTDDGASTWVLVHDNHHPQVFYDGMAFWDRSRGIIMGDPIDGRFAVLVTDDGGRHWQAPAERPLAQQREAGFAASGTGITVRPGGHVWFGTGGSVARVFHSTDYGQHFVGVDTSMASSEASGVFSLVFLDDQQGIAVGGDYRRVDVAEDNVAYSRDGGRSWSLLQEQGLSGFREVVAVVPRADEPIVLAVGPSGGDRSIDGGRTWQPLVVPTNLHSVAVQPDGQRVYAVGADGIVAVAEWTP